MNATVFWIFLRKIFSYEEPSVTVSVVHWLGYRWDTCVFSDSLFPAVLWHSKEGGRSFVKKTLILEGNCVTVSFPD